MALMDMFRSNAAQPTAPTASTPSAPSAPKPGVGNPGNIPSNKGNDKTPPAGEIPNSPDPVAPKPPESPFDQFSKLWENDPTKPDLAESNKQLFNVDPAKLQEAAGKVNFSQIVSPEILARINAGGEDGVKATMEAMNKMAQQVYAQSALATTKITEQAVNKAREQMEAQLPTMLKRQQVSANLRDENPVFKNPAVSPILDALEHRLVTKYPDATPNEITAMAKSYVEALATSAQKPAPEPDPNVKGEMDWSKFLEVS